MKTFEFQRCYLIFSIDFTKNLTVFLVSNLKFNSKDAVYVPLGFRLRCSKKINISDIKSQNITLKCVNLS